MAPSGATDNSSGQNLISFSSCDTHTHTRAHTHTHTPHAPHAMPLSSSCQAKDRGDLIRASS
jgi:hypothetical protein